MKDKPVKIDDLRTWSTYMVDLLLQGRTSLLRDQIIYVLDNQELTGALWLNKKCPCIDWDVYIYNPRFIRKGITLHSSAVSSTPLITDRS